LIKPRHLRFHAVMTQARQPRIARAFADEFTGAQ
jgi:hypothetical protein